MKPIDINPNDLETVRRILKKHVPDIEVRVFGSRVSWTARETSDLDLALMTTEPLPDLCIAELKEALTESDLPFKVDVVDWAITSKEFRRIIEKENVVLQGEISQGVVDEWRQISLAKLGYRMTSNWEEEKIVSILADQRNAIAMGPFGSRIKKDNFVSDGVTIIKGGNLTDGYLNEENYDYLTEDKANELRASMAYRGDIVITHRGTIGQVGLVPESSKHEKYIVSQSQLKLTLDTNKADPYFVFYFFQSKKGRHRLLVNSSQVGVPAIARASSSVKEIKIPLPPLSVQKTITKILRALDDKIELNGRMNETLEAMARAIFKDWFVDFGPTRSKAEGREPYLAKEIWDLFPDKLDDQGKPQGWEGKCIGDILALVYGKALKATDRVEGAIPVYGSGGIAGYHNKALVEGPGIIVGRKGTVGSLYWEDRSFFPIDTVFYVDKKVPLTFCFYLLQTLALNEMNTDAAVPGLNRSNVYRLPVVWSPNETRTAFDEIVKSLRKKMCLNLTEAQTLARTRDFLLPRLMSGEIRLKDAEKTVEEAV